MARPSKLTPAQWADVERRAAEGESISALAREFGVSAATISVRVSNVSKNVRKVAQQMAEAQTALAELPPRQQHLAVSLADKLRNISDSMSSAAELGAKTAHRLHALANEQAAKIDDADPLKDRDTLQGVAALLKLGNEAGTLPCNLIAANKETVTRINNPQEVEKAAPVRERLGLAEWKKAHGLG